MGIDLDDPLLHAEWEQRTEPNLEYRIMKAENLPFADGEFELAAAIEVLEHVPDPEATVAEMARVADCGPIFGMGGFQLLPFYEGCRALGLRHVLINDERMGAFAADAWARVTNRPGWCDGTLGPGATNLVTGLVESLNAGVPLVAIVGDAHRAHAWKNMTQEARQIEILRPAVKELLRVERVERSSPSGGRASRSPHRSVGRCRSGGGA